MGLTPTSPHLRVLHCIGGLGGGGAERQLSYLSAGLIRKGIDVHVAYLRPGPNLTRAQDSGATLHELRSHGNYDPFLPWRLIKLVRKVRPDLIQTWLPQMDILAGLAAVLTKTPLLMTERSSVQAYNGNWKGGLRSWLGRRAALIVANSNSGREYWMSKTQPDLIKVIRNGVPVEEIQRTPPICWEARDVLETTEVLLFAGRYSPEKNTSTLLDAIFLVLAERANAIALLFGEGPQKSELMERVKRQGMEDRVRILGYTTQLWSWMKRAKVFVSVSLFEGSPNTVLEAAAQRCPLVLSDIAEHRELFVDEMVFFVPPRTPGEIAHAILEVFRDPEGAKRRAESAYERVSRLTVDSVIGEYLSAYRLALAKSGFPEGAKEERLGETT